MILTDSISKVFIKNEYKLIMSELIKRQEIKFSSENIRIS